MKRTTIALMIIFAVISMPFAEAVVMSGDGYGKDNRQGMVRSRDDLSLRVQVLGVQPSAGDIKYRPVVGAPVQFESCTDEFCMLLLRKQSFESRPYEYPVRYEGGGERKDIIISVYPDVAGAEVNGVSVDREIVGLDNTIKFSADVSDTSCLHAGCAGKCSGIKQVNIYEGDMNHKVGEIGVFSDECSAKAEKTFPVSSLVKEGGQKNFIFEAVDNFGNPAVATKTLLVDVDDTPPVLNTESFSLTKDGRDISFYNKPVANVVVSFPLNDEFSSMSAGLSALNPSLRTVQMDCNEIVCSKAITLNLGAESSRRNALEISVTLTDEFGNSEVYTLSKDVEIDVEGPEVRRVSSTQPSMERNLGYGPKTNLIVEMRDSGAGVAGANIYADFSEINPAFPSVKAVSCIDSKCNFTAVPIVNEGVKSIKILGMSSDDIGNVMGADYPVSLYVDKTINNNVNIEFAGFEETDIGDENAGYPTRGDKLVISALLNEPVDIFAYGDFSSINEEGKIEGRCRGGSKPSGWRPEIPEERLSAGRSELSAGQIRCEWEVEVTKSGSVIDGSVELFFEDPFGNSFSQIVPIPNIYGVDEEESPNYWSSKVKCSPSYLDRQVGELMEQQMFCSVFLSPLSQNQQIMGIELDDCEDEDNFVDDAVLNNAYGQYPYIALTFKSDEYETNLIDINCMLNILTRVGYDIKTNEEHEVVNIPVELFNNPFSMPDDAVINKINGIRDKWGARIGDVIRWLNVLQRLATRLCRIMGVLQKMKVGSILGAKAVPDATGGAGVRMITDIGSTAPAEANRQASNKFCDWVNCQPLNNKKGAWKFINNKGFLDEIYEPMINNNVLGGRFLDNAGVPRSDYVDIKNNYILSALSFCIPGIVQNLEKYRQIQCFYGYCLQDISVDAGIPASICEKQKAYNECMFFITPIFKVIPWMSFIDTWSNRIKNAISDPFAMIGVVFNIMCPSYDQIGWGVCRFVNIVNIAIDAYDDIRNIIEEFKGFSNDFCKDLGDSPRSS
jgi:hypothetical protein